jgi:adenylate cyclase
MSSISEPELASRAGTTVEQVRRLIQLGIVAPGENGAFEASDIQRVRITQALDTAGISLQDIGQMIAAGQYSTAWAETLFPDPVPLSGQTFAQLAAEHGIPFDLLASLYVTWGLPRPEPNNVARADDAELVRLSSFTFALLPAETGPSLLLAAGRYLGENTRRIAESQMRSFRAIVEEPLFAAGMSPAEVIDTVSVIGAQVIPVVERGLQLLHRRHLEHYIVEDIVANTELTLEHAGLAQRRPANPPAIAFLDLSGYTALTEEQGDLAAADLASRLADTVRDAARAQGGQPVKLLGDGVMFHFPEPGGAVLCGLELVARVPELGLPRARMGAHVGPVVFRDGDFFGRTVSVAARITDYARPGEVLVSDDIAIRARPSGVGYRPLGPVPLKGLTSPVALYVAERAPSD